MTTVEAARAARLHLLGHATSSTAVEDLEAAIRAESAETLAALREAALPVIAIAQRAMLNRDGQPYFPEPNGALYQGDKRAIERLRALAATPAESDYLTRREQRRLACACGHPLIRHTEYGCIDCGTSEASTPQHNFTRKFAATPAER